jgi:hypothetical protein
MAKDPKEMADKKVREGWIRAWMAIEVIAIDAGSAESSLKKHMDLMCKHDFALIYKKDLKKPEKVPHPFEKGKDAYSQVVEIELVTRRYENLFYLVMNYAPSSIEILEPAQLKIDMGEGQGILNSLAELIHTFAAASRGCLAIDTK